MDIAFIGDAEPARVLFERCLAESDPGQALLDALQRCAGIKSDSSSPLDRIIESLTDNDELPWIITAVYSRLRRMQNSLPEGTVFTPPWLADEVVKNLLPGLTVVDLGAGSGMLTIAAAKKGFRVVAIEENNELAQILDSLSRMMGLQRRIELRICNALSYSRRKEAQIMANPPFTRHHAIPVQKKHALTEMASELGLPLQMTTGYYGYFMIYAWASKWSKRDVLLLPTNWLEARYGTPLRKMLLTRCFEISLVENGDQLPIFDHALTTICLLTTWPRRPEDCDCKIKTPLDILRGPYGRAVRKEVSQDKLAIRLARRLGDSVQNKNSSTHFLGDIFKVKRGIAIGCNEFFVISEASALSLGISDGELRKILRKLPPNSNSIDVDCLWVPCEPPSEASLRRISEGEKLKVNQRYLCAHRKPWWRVEAPSPPAYFLAYMGRARPRILENKTGILHLNNTHGLYIKEGISSGLAKRAIKWLNSEDGIDALSNQARYYCGGMWKLEPRDVESTNLPVSLF